MFVGSTFFYSIITILTSCVSTRDFFLHVSEKVCRLAEVIPNMNNFLLLILRLLYFFLLAVAIIISLSIIVFVVWGWVELLTGKIKFQ
jgi:hypothetical protein